MSRTAVPNIKIKNTGILLGTFNTLDFLSGISAVDSGLSIAGVTAGGAGTYHSELLTDSGDHQNFTALHTINTVFNLMDGSGKGIPSNLYSFAGTTLTFTSADTNIASLGVYLVYA